MTNTIQLPPLGGVGSKSKWPWHTLEVGQSFLAEGMPIQKMSALACKAAIRLNYKYSCRTTEDGTRVWRVR